MVSDIVVSTLVTILGRKMNPRNEAARITCDERMITDSRMHVYNLVNLSSRESLLLRDCLGGNMRRTTIFTKKSYRGSTVLFVGSE